MVICQEALTVPPYSNGGHVPQGPYDNFGRLGVVAQGFLLSLQTMGCLMYVEIFVIPQGERKTASKYALAYTSCSAVDFPSL